MSGKQAKRERYQARHEKDLARARSLNFAQYVADLPLGKAVLVECDALDARTVRLPKELGGSEIRVETPYTKPESGKVALAVAKTPQGNVVYGIKSTQSFEKRGTLRYDARSGEFRSTNCSSTGK